MRDVHCVHCCHIVNLMQLDGWEVRVQPPVAVLSHTSVRGKVPVLSHGTRACLCMRVSWQARVHADDVGDGFLLLGLCMLCPAGYGAERVDHAFCMDCMVGTEAVKGWHLCCMAESAAQGARSTRLLRGCSLLGQAAEAVRLHGLPDTHCCRTQRSVKCPLPRLQAW